MTQVSSPSHIPRRAAAEAPIREALQLCGSHFRYALLFSALVNIAYLAPTLYMLQVYDRVVPSGSGPTLFFLTAVLSFTLLTLTSLDQVRQNIMTAASIRLDKIFSARLFRHAFSPPTGAGASPRLNQMVRDFDVIRQTATGPAALAFFDAPWIPIYILVCFIVHPFIGGLALFGSVVLMVLAIINERAMRGLIQRSGEATARSFAAQEAAGGSVDVVRALGMTAAFTAQFESSRNAASIPQLEAQRAQGRIGGLIRFLRLFLQSAALGLGAWLAINKQISAGSIFAASMLAARALSPIDQIVAQWRSVATAMTAYRAVKEQLRGDPPVDQTYLPSPAPILTLDKLSVVTPQRDRYVLRDVSMELRGGTVLGVLGSSGAGKTTLLQAIANARPADQGDIRIDGARYRDWDSQRLARYIGYLPQDSVLFPGTVKDNISRFDRWNDQDPETVDAMAVAAARAAGVHELILALPAGYDTVLGPRGLGLSAGQQQRIALSRALYGDPLIYVFDEPNSNLDADGEAGLVRTIAYLKQKGSIVVVAAHRLSIIGTADYLAILGNGRVERFGPRNDVLEALRTAGAPGTGLPVAPATTGT